MGMHQVDFKLYRSGSKLFDIVMTNAAKTLCHDCPGLSYETDAKEIRIFGELDEESYARYMSFMFATDTELAKQELDNEMED